MIATADQPGDEGTVLENVSWDFYERVLDELGNRRVFVTFDRGRLEIMSPSYEHERSGRILGKILEIFAEELDIPLIGAGSTTFRLRNVEGGLEPDDCYYVQNVSAIEGKHELDLSIDPPPDLAIEVEVSRRLADRIEVYRRLGIPEIWCYDTTKLVVLRLSDGAYVKSDTSGAFPLLPLNQIQPLVQRSWQMNETAWSRYVRGWVRENFPVL